MARVAKRVTCARCGQSVDGWSEYDDAGHIVDSYGYMEYEVEFVCDTCTTKQTGIHPDSIVWAN